MKTAAEIVEYIMQQYWYQYFINNASSLNGKNGEYTVKSAFNWEETEQGYKYWEFIDKEFTKWFNN